MSKNILKYLLSLPNREVSGPFSWREMTPPVKLSVKYWMNSPGAWVWRDVTIRYLYPNCFQDIMGWQKPYWTITEWK